MFRLDGRVGYVRVEIRRTVGRPGSCSVVMRAQRLRPFYMPQMARMLGRS